MTFSSKQVQLSLDELVKVFFQQSEGQWRSQRRYYTLHSGETQEVLSLLTVQFLEPGDEQLRQLARKHSLEDETAFTCGAYTTWESDYVGPSPRKSKGATIFGVKGDNLYRDRGFSTTKPVVAKYTMRGDKTMVLRTEYGGDVFEEEIKLIGTQYRTRQTIISRAGEEQMIGQYLETRV